MYPGGGDFISFVLRDFGLRDYRGVDRSVFGDQLTGKNVIKNPTGWENAAVESVITKEGQKALNTKKKVRWDIGGFSCPLFLCAD